MDLDHGTFPYVTSSNSSSLGLPAGCGVPARMVNKYIGVIKAYTTRVGAGPFPTELFDDDGRYLGEKGHEFGATTGRQRRCGWLDIVSLRRSLKINSVTGMCVTKLDVLDGMERVKICVAYKLDGKEITAPPVGADLFEKCEPVYIEMPGWKTSTVGVKSVEQLPLAARDYLAKVEELCGAPVDIISTGPDREETIIRRHPFE